MIKIFVPARALFKQPLWAKHIHMCQVPLFHVCLRQSEPKSTSSDLPGQAWWGARDNLLIFIDTGGWGNIWKRLGPQKWSSLSRQTWRRHKALVTWAQHCCPSTLPLGQKSNWVIFESYEVRVVCKEAGKRTVSKKNFSLIKCLCKAPVPWHPLSRECHG